MICKSSSSKSVRNRNEEFRESAPAHAHQHTDSTQFPAGWRVAKDDGKLIEENFRNKTMAFLRHYWRHYYRQFNSITNIDPIIIIPHSLDRSWAGSRIDDRIWTVTWSRTPKTITVTKLSEHSALVRWRIWHTEHRAPELRPQMEIDICLMCNAIDSKKN